MTIPPGFIGCDDDLTLIRKLVISAGTRSMGTAWSRHWRRPILWTGRKGHSTLMGRRKECAARSSAGSEVRSLGQFLGWYETTPRWRRTFGVIALRMRRARKK